MDPSGGTPGPVKKKANSTGVSPDKDDDSPTLEQIELVSQLGKLKFQSNILRWVSWEGGRVSSSRVIRGRL